MTSRDFVYWLQGFFEITGTDKVSPEQVKVIRNHINMVFKHEIDPSHGDDAHQAESDSLIRVSSCSNHGTRTITGV